MHSGPKERTSSHASQAASSLVRRQSAEMTLEERGEGDGQEVPSPTRPPRDVSSAGSEISKLIVLLKKEYMYGCVRLIM